MKKRILFMVLVLSLVVSVSGCQSAPPIPIEETTQTNVPTETAPGADATTREITDLAGRKVVIPVNPHRIAAMTGPSYEMVFMLGGQDRTIMVKSGHTTNYPVALLTNPDLANLIGVAANPSANVNVEEYLKYDVDLVIYYLTDSELQKFAAANIPAIVLTLNTSMYESTDELKKLSLDQYIDNTTKAVSILADVLGGDAIEKYKAWYRYNDEKIRMMYERTHNLPEEQLKTVYWGNTWGEDILATYTLRNRWYEVRLAGGALVGPEIGGNFPDITAEQLFVWDPDIILVDNHGHSPDLVINNMYKEGSRWATLHAVQNKELHRIPAGVFFLDKGTTTTLMALWMGTIIQPELFADINILDEIKYYYKEFYEFELSDEQAQNILDGWYIRTDDSDL